MKGGVTRDIIGLVGTMTLVFLLGFTWFCLFAVLSLTWPFPFYFETFGNLSPLCACACIVIAAWITSVKGQTLNTAWLLHFRFFLPETKMLIAQKNNY